MMTTLPLKKGRISLQGSAPTAPRQWIGEVLKETYRIDRAIGEGGTGLVFAGTHLRLKVAVAVKILKQNAGPLAFARFRKEAEITARLRHPNIVQILDYDVSPDGHAYIVTEWLDGETFSAFIKRSGAVSAEVAVSLLQPVCDAVAAAHAAGVVHRDLKPANLFLSRTTGNTAEPLVKVLDFGIAKLTDVDPVRTEQGQTVGTPRYMSPEQIRVDAGDEVGPPSDQFSLGSIAYELVSGRPAFPGSAHAAMLSVLDGRPPPLPGSVPYGYRRAVARALSRRPQDRFPSLIELGAALQEVLEQPPPMVWPRGLMLGGAGVAAVLLVMILLINHGTRDTGPAPDGGGLASRVPPTVTPLDMRAVSTKAPEVGPAPQPEDPPEVGPGPRSEHRVAVHVHVAPAGSQLYVNGRAVACCSVDLQQGVPARLRAVAPPNKRHCCPAKEMSYVPGAKGGTPQLVLSCDPNCPIY